MFSISERTLAELIYEVFCADNIYLSQPKMLPIRLKLPANAFAFADIGSCTKMVHFGDHAPKILSHFLKHIVDLEVETFINRFRMKKCIFFLTSFFVFFCQMMHRLCVRSLKHPPRTQSPNRVKNNKMQPKRCVMCVGWSFYVVTLSENTFRKH